MTAPRPVGKRAEMSGPAPSPVKVLLVDDQVENLLALEAVLAPFGYHLIKASSGETALLRLLEHDVAVIVLDVNMPGLDGFETARLIKGRERSRHTPIIFLTGTDLDRQFSGYAVGAVDYLSKPANPLILRSKIEVFAELHRHKEQLVALNETLEQRVAERTAEVLRKDEELRTMTEQLWQAGRLATLGELAASVAHELNNPLGTVSLRLEGLLEQAPANDPQRRGLEIIEREVERMASLVSNLLQFSRRSTKQISTLDIREEIENTLELIHYHLRNRRIAVVREVAPELPKLQADRQQLRQLFLNLFTNAADAMPSGGTLTLRVRQQAAGSGQEAENSRQQAAGSGQQAVPSEGFPLPAASCRLPAVVIEVCDTGVGIAPEDLPKVLEPFFTTKPEGKGTGLGLPICRRIVQEHQGTLELTSEVGKGTTVRITLPISNGANAAHLRGTR